MECLRRVLGSPAPGLPAPPAMDLFPDGGFVRLRNRANGKYLTADEDWVGVSLQDSPRGADPSHSRLTQVWRVERRVTPDGVFFLLQGAAYGRYLALTPAGDPAPGFLGLRAAQRDLDERHLVDAMAFRWRADREGAFHEYVRIRHSNSNRKLRATGRYRPWNTGVTVDLHRRGRFWITTMMHWTVMPVEASPEPLPLPLTPPQSPIQEALRGLMFWRRQVDPLPPRTIRHVRENAEGDFDQNHEHWPMFRFHDRSVFNLRTQVAYGQADWSWSSGDLSYVTLCVRPGLNGRLVPLVTDLPRSGEPMDIVVLNTGSPAAAALVYPHFDPLAL